MIASVYDSRSWFDDFIEDLRKLKDDPKAKELDLAIKKWWEEKVEPVAKLAGEETIDFFHGMLIGIAQGEKGRIKASDLGGPTAPERIGFQIGLAGGPAVREWIWGQIKAAIIGLTIPAALAPLIQAALKMLESALTPTRTSSSR